MTRTTRIARMARTASMTRMSGALAGAAWVALALAGCGKDSRADRQALPPATGSGAPPLPALPALAKPEPPAATASARRSTGTLLPHSEVAVVARASGVVTELPVEVGAHVRQGQVVFRVDDRGAALRLAQAQTQLAAAELQLQTAEVEYRRARSLFEQQAVTQQRWDQASAEREVARVGVAQAKNGVAVAGKAVADATARAPITGVVVARPVALGDYVSDAPPTRVLVVQDQATLDLKFRLPEQALASVRTGDPISVSLPALAASRTAKVAIVAPSVDPRTRTIELTAVLDNRDGALRPGLMADVALASAPASTP
jgi:membrane fusion protein, multidrug efflux system